MLKSENCDHLVIYRMFYKKNLQLPLYMKLQYYVKYMTYKNVHWCLQSCYLQQVCLFSSLTLSIKKRETQLWYVWYMPDIKYNISRKKL